MNRIGLLDISLRTFVAMSKTMSFLIACFSAQQLERSFSDRRTRNDATGRLPHRSSGVHEHPNGLKRVKILEATGEGRTSLFQRSQEFRAQNTETKNAKRKASHSS